MQGRDEGRRQARELIPSRSRLPTVGVDVGGTFTDVVLLRGGKGPLVHKLPSTPRAPEEAILSAMAFFELQGRGYDLLHGTTVATNALLEREGARTAFVTTAGFRDLLILARQNRPALYALHPEPRPPHVPSEDSFEVAERLDAEGRVLRPLDEEGARRLARGLRRRRYETVAVCLLFSYLNPDHEKQLGEIFAAEGLDVSLSCEVLPRCQEYERASTTVANAFVTPVMDRYLGLLEEGGPRSLRIMGSAGGSLTPELARRHAVQTALSGPAAGVAGARALARRSGVRRFLTLDMGGTSTDVALVDGRPAITQNWEVGGLPLAVPALDILTIGAGGGSLARIDPGGALRVGPRSAGARPGPACYGLGGQDATVTDAHVVLGHIDTKRFLGGRMALDEAASHRALAALLPPSGRRRKKDVEALAADVLAVADSNMERALRRISLDRGADVRRFHLLPFGGAGPLHACALAKRLDMEGVLLPAHAGALSALGLLFADEVWTRSHTVMLRDEAITDEAVGRAVTEELASLGNGESWPRREVRLELRYHGQSFELAVPWSKGGVKASIEAFHRLHRRRYGHALPEASVELVHVRVRLSRRGRPPRLTRLEGGGSDPRPARVGCQKAAFDGSWTEATVYAREALQAGMGLVGPAVVVEPTSTFLLPPSFTARMDEWGNLHAVDGKKRP